MATSIRRFNFLDQLEVLEAKNYEEDFPLHLHDKLCITLVTRGVECTQVNTQELLSPYESISLTYANEIHANPNKNNGKYSFVTYYLSPDVLGYFYGKESYYFKHRILTNQNLYNGLLQFATLSNPSEVQFTSVLKALVKYLTKSPNHTIGDEMAKLDFTNVLAYMDGHYANSISIQELANMKDLSRFSFIRAFKKIKGITPAQYLTLRRIEASKDLLLKGHTIIDAALSSGFYDQSHMSRNFKKLTGITPRQYQQACNIIQES